MKNTIKFSLIAITAIAALSTAMFAFDSQDVQPQKVMITGGSLQNFSVEDLSEGAKYVINGKVKDIQPVEDDSMGETIVFSDVTIKVKEELFGNYDEKEITVRVMGGETPNVKHISHDDASFEKNEHVLVFVAGPEPDSIWGNNYYVAGLELGKYKFENGKAIQKDKQDKDEVELKDKIKKYRADKVN